MKLILQQLMLKNKRTAGLLMPLLVFAFILVGSTGEVAAQGHKRVVQLTGFVTIGDSLYGVAGVNVYVPKTSRGTQTNAYGFFSVPVLTGDSVVFSAIGYKKQYLIIPKNYQSQGYSIIMQMQEDPTQLPEVQVFPWATERDFKDAVLAVKVPDDGMAIAMRNLDPKRLEELFSVTPMDGNANFRNWNMQNVQRQEQRNMFPTVSPFAIIQLLNMLKNGEFNKK